MSNHLAFPAVTQLLLKYGSTPEGRKRARDEIADAVRAEGKRLIERALVTSGRSPSCAGTGGYAEPRHAGGWGGCANDGSTCICQCHDQPTEDTRG